MIFSNGNVELTKVHYNCDISDIGRNTEISIISKNPPQLGISKHPIIKKNIFGHKWVLKINESEKTKNKSYLKFIYISVFICILIAVSFGIFFSIDLKLSIQKITRLIKPYEVPINNNSTYNQSNKIELHCHCNCETNEVCLKTIEDKQPECKLIIDQKDPTGCGGLCKINAEYCKRLDPSLKVYQCRPLINILNCSKGLFNCGNRCIATTMRCDGVINCSNKLDEQNCDCDLQTHFQCGNFTSCLHLSKQCDGKVDCWDNFDEINCSNGCPNHKVPCHNGQCINKENICDGIYHCMDKSDELIGCEIHK